jgi:hypothetical protein
METLKSVDVREGGDKGDNVVDNGREVDGRRVWRRPAGGGQFIVRSRVAAAGVVVVAVLLTASGCSLLGSHGSKPNVQPGPGRASPSASLSPSGAPKSSAEREAADRAAVEQAWAGYWTTYDEMDTKYPPAQWRQVISRYAVDPIVSQVVKALEADRRIGVISYGYVVPHPYWQQAIIGRSIAVMGDCMDQSHVGSKYKKTGQKRTVGVARDNIRAFFVRGGDRGWRVSQIEYLVDQKC